VTATATRDLDTHHLFTPPETRGAWEARAKELRSQILFAAGLDPLPEKTPLNPRVTGKVEGPDYIIKNVAIETYPGFFLCGNLYSPKGRVGPFPAVLHPHGHWAHGRLQMDADVPKAAPAPAEKGKGRGNLPAIGVNLARQGFVVFAWDMVGYNDTNQVRDHRAFAKDARPWLWNISLLGLQLWNSIRVTDYVTSLPNIDKERIGMTGASGGGTQTFLLSAVDDRIAAAVPVNMVSAGMQGGCLCENGPGLRLGTDNVEIASVMAPRPQLLVSATGDWTKNCLTEEWPALKRIYDLFGKGQNTAVVQFNYEHNFNVESREAMYAWFGRWLLKDADASHFREQPFTTDAKNLRVWTEQNPRPADALTEEQLIQKLKDATELRLSALWPRDKDGLKTFREKMAPALAHSLHVNIDPKRSPSKPVVLEVPIDAFTHQAVLIVASATQRDRATKLAVSLSIKGRALYMFVDAPARTGQSLWDNFFTCYNRTPLGDGVQQVLDVLEGLRPTPNAEHIRLVGLGEGGLVALLARGLFPDIESTVVDVNNFDNSSDDAYLAGPYAPGLRYAGEFRTAALLAADKPLCLFNTGTAFKTDVIAAGYRATGGKLTLKEGDLPDADIAKLLEP